MEGRPRRERRRGMRLVSMGRGEAGGGGRKLIQRRLAPLVGADVCYKPADMCSPEHMKERQEASANYHNMVSHASSCCL